MIVFTDSLCNSALFRSSRRLVGLTSYERIHNMVPAGGTVTNHNNPGSGTPTFPLCTSKCFLPKLMLVSPWVFTSFTDTLNNSRMSHEPTRHNIPKLAGKSTPLHWFFSRSPPSEWLIFYSIMETRNSGVVPNSIFSSLSQISDSSS